jgi:hypothetical protein
MRIRSHRRVTVRVGYRFVKFAKAWGKANPSVKASSMEVESEFMPEGPFIPIYTGARCGTISA